MKPTTAVVQFPGSNCDEDAIRAIRGAGLEPIVVHYNEPEAQEMILESDSVFIPGGFTYNDWGRAGLVASLNDNIMSAIKEKADQGTPVLGVCNGNQIGLEARLLGDDYDIAMAKNAPRTEAGIRRSISGFINENVNIILSQNPYRTAFTQHLVKESPFKISIAHAEGNYTMTRDTFENLNEKGMILFQYADQHGRLNPFMNVNPNGSVGNIAGLTNEEGNVVLMMPHPERDILGNYGTGFRMLTSLRDYLSEPLIDSTPTRTRAKYDELPPTEKAMGDYALVLEATWKTTDNTEFIIDKHANRLAGPVSLERKDLYIIEAYENGTSPEELATKIIKSAQMIKTNKHSAVAVMPDGKRKSYHGNSFQPSQQIAGTVIDVLEKHDYAGDGYASVLSHDFNMEEIASVQTGTRWYVSGKNYAITKIINRRLLHNPLLNHVKIH